MKNVICFWTILMLVLVENGFGYAELVPPVIPPQYIHLLPKGVPKPAPLPWYFRPLTVLGEAAILLAITPRTAGDPRYDTTAHLTERQKGVLEQFRKSQFGFLKVDGPVTIEDLVDWLPELKHKYHITYVKRPTSTRNEIQINPVIRSTQGRMRFSQFSNEDSEEVYNVPIQVSSAELLEVTDRDGGLNSLITVEDLNRPGGNSILFPIDLLPYNIQTALEEGQQLDVRFLILQKRISGQLMRVVEDVRVEIPELRIFHRVRYDTDKATRWDRKQYSSWDSHKLDVLNAQYLYGFGPEISEALKPRLERPWVPTAEEFTRDVYQTAQDRIREIGEEDYIEEEEAKQALEDKIAVEILSKSFTRNIWVKANPMDAYQLYLFNRLISQPRFKRLLKYVNGENRSVLDLWLREAQYGFVGLARITLDFYKKYRGVDELADLAHRYRDLGLFDYLLGN